jgi:hypothetical protein
MLLAPEDGAERAAFLAAATTSCSRPGCCLLSLTLRARHCATARGDPLSAAWPGLCPSAIEVLGLDDNHNMLWHHCSRALLLVSAHHRETFPGLQQAAMRQRTRRGVLAVRNTPGISERAVRALRGAGPIGRMGLGRSCGRSRCRCALQPPRSGTRRRAHAAARWSKRTAHW